MTAELHQWQAQQCSDCAHGRHHPQHCCSTECVSLGTGRMGHTSTRCRSHPACSLHLKKSCYDELGTLPIACTSNGHAR